MLNFNFVKQLLEDHGPLNVTAYDRGGKFNTVTIEKDDVQLMINRMSNLNDGADRWVYSVEIG